MRTGPVRERGTGVPRRPRPRPRRVRVRRGGPRGPAAKGRRLALHSRTRSRSRGCSSRRGSPTTSSSPRRFLHDVVEDTDPWSSTRSTSASARASGDLVAAMTEDKDDRAVRAPQGPPPRPGRGRRASAPRAIYAADKVANLRDLRTLYASVGEAVAARSRRRSTSGCGSGAAMPRWVERDRARRWGSSPSCAPSSTPSTPSAATTA